MKKKYKFLNDISFPSDLRKVEESNLQKVADEVREEMISAVSETGGHLGAGLGVVELTVALHFVFDTAQAFLELALLSQRFHLFADHYWQSVY